MKIKRITLAILMAAASTLILGCAEKPQAQESAGRYQGKPDAKPWEAAGKDKAAWEAQLKTRAQNQNDYSRAE
jgi:hypothetical protein